jgi:hypothetical protein
LLLGQNRTRTSEVNYQPSGATVPKPHDELPNRPCVALPFRR